MTDAAISAPAASPSSGGVDDELRRMLGERTARATAYGASFVALWEAAADTLLGGKMLRPRLLLAAYDALTESPDAAAARASVVRIAAAVEVLHFAFLLHDDVIDGDLQRRGRPNLIGTLLNQRAGLRARDDAHWARTNALLLGDVLLSDAHQILAREDLPHEQRVRLLDLLDHTVTESVAGEQLDVGLADRILPADLTTVLDMTRLKTATYTFEMPLRAGAILAGRTTATELAVAELGRHLGIAFQLQDDLLSTFGRPDEHGKDAYSDLREGKETAAIAYARMTSAWPAIEAHFGSAHLTAAEGDLLRSHLTGCGAEAFVQSLIDDQLRACVTLLADPDAGIPAALHPVISDILTAIEGRRA